MKIATSLNISVSRFTADEIMPRLAEAGYEGVDFNFCDLQNKPGWQTPSIADAYTDTLASAASEAGLVWVQAHGPMFNLFSSEPSDRKGHALCKPALRACRRLGVPWMVLHPDTTAGPFDADHRRTVFDMNVAFFRSLLPACEKYNVGIAIENIPDSCARNDRGAPRYFASVPDELIELIDTLNHPLIGACWDTGHAHQNRLDQRGAIIALGSRLKALHVQDARNDHDSHVLPFGIGSGGVEWDKVIDGLAATAYDGPLTYEVHNAFNSVPDELFDQTLRYSVDIARHLIARIKATRSRKA